MIRTVLKRTAFTLASVMVSPMLVSFWLRSRIIDKNRALMGSSQFLALFPGLIGQYLRRAFYARVLESCDWTATIEYGSLFSKVGARLGANVYIGPMCHIGLVDIGADVLLAAGVHIPSGPLTHGIDDTDKKIREQPGTLQCLRIGQGSWVGAAAVVLADIGKESVIAAGAVVTKPVPERVIAAGIPARVVRSRDLEIGKPESASPDPD